MTEHSPYRSRTDNIKDEKMHKKSERKGYYAVTYTHAHASISDE